MRVILFVLVVGVAACAGGAAPASTQASADGTSFGDVGDQKVKPEQLPLVGTALGNQPTVLLQRRPAYAAAVQKAEDLIKAGHVPHGLVVRYPSEFYCRGTNSSVLGFDVDGGRVVAVTLYYQADRVRPDASVLDGYKNTIHRINERASIGVILDTPADPHVLVIKYNAADWYLANHAASADVTAAIRARQPIVGMTEAECNATLFMFRQLQRRENGQSKLVAYGSYRQVPETVVDGKTIPATEEEVRAWQIVFKDGKVAEVTKF